MEKREIRRLCQETETRISADWQYVRSNAGQLVWSAFWDGLIPRRKDKEEGQEDVGFWRKAGLGMVWQLAKPLLYQWAYQVGWQVLKNIFRRHRAEGK